MQTLGLSHALSSIMWLCGPVAGFVVSIWDFKLLVFVVEWLQPLFDSGEQVQPCVGLWSDKCRSRLGRRRPFLLAGCTMICVAVSAATVIISLRILPLITWSSYMDFYVGAPGDRGRVFFWHWTCSWWHERALQVSFFFSRCMSFVSLIDTCDPCGNAVCIMVLGGMQR